MGKHTVVVKKNKNKKTDFGKMSRLLTKVQSVREILRTPRHVVRHQELSGTNYTQNDETNYI